MCWSARCSGYGSVFRTVAPGAGKRCDRAIRTVDHLVDQGRELGQMVNDFTWYMRNLLLIQSADDMEEVLDMSADHLAALKEEAQMVEPETLIRYIRIFSELSSQIRMRHKSASCWRLQL